MPHAHVSKTIPHTLKVHRLAGSSAAWWLSELQVQRQQPLLILCESFEQAESCLGDLAFFSGKDGLHFFPSWDVMPYDFFSPQKELVGQRMQTLDALLHENVRFVVTTPQAVMQRVLPKELFQNALLDLKTEASLAEHKLRRKFRMLGYVEVDTVEDRGEFCLRGTRLDIFPSNQSTPFRLELRGRDASGLQRISSIHPFDLRSQISEQTTLLSLRLLPASEVQLSPEQCDHALDELEQYREQLPDNQFSSTQHTIRNGQPFPGMESLAALYHKLDTVFDYLPPKTRVVLQEDAKLQQHATFFRDEVLREAEMSMAQGRLTLDPDLLFLGPADLESLLEEWPCVGVTSAHEVEAPPDPLAALRAGFQRLAGASSQSFSFQGNSSLREGFRAAKALSAVGNAMERLRTWQAERVPVVLAARSQTQADHFRELLFDLEVESRLLQDHFSGADSPPLPSSILPWAEFCAGTGWSHKLAKQWGWNPQTTGILPIVVGEVSSGFRLLDAENQVCFALVTEDEVFGKKTRQRRLQRVAMPGWSGSLDDLNEGDFVVHLDYGIGCYRGLQKIEAAGIQNEFMLLTFAREEKVYVPVSKFHLVQKYVHPDGGRPKLNKLGEKAWKKTRSRVAKAVEDIAEELAEIYAARKARRGHAFERDSHEMQEFEQGFPFEETPDQLEVIMQVKRDMESTMPMDRLVCGDVGFGKTEVAMRAVFKAVSDGKQVAMLVPTTILAQQHDVSFRQRFEETAITVESLSRFRTTAEQRGILKRLAEGKLDLVIGTHRLLSKDVKFADLGLLVVDEEQRFGVKQKERIKQFRAEVDVLTLSATPIPRTLHMSLMGLRDLSIINTPPADRIAIRTRLVHTNDTVIQEAVSRELRRQGQVFVVHNRVETIFEYGRHLQRILPQVRIAVAHGQMSEHQLEQLMLDFIEGRYDLLLSTTIIESGLDIPRANTILINNADRFGLAQLYQLRGRVGRSNVQAFAYLMVLPEKIISQTARDRLQVLQDLNDLGVGFKLASRDLEIRGAGNLLGSEQSGQIASVGLELYTQMVDRAVKRLQRQEAGQDENLEVRVIFNAIVQEVPDAYIPNTNKRLSLYKTLASLDAEDTLWDLRNGTEDRFGPLPEALLNLFKSAQVRIWAQERCVQTVELRGEKLRLQIAKPDALNHETLIHWLSEPDSALRYIPENTLEVCNVPPDFDAILGELRLLEDLFAGKSAPLPAVPFPTGTNG